MNYRHAFHAGSFADVLKHAALALVVERFKSKPQPFVVIDTHAGAGRYDLQSEQAARTGESRDGIARVFALAEPPEGLRPYLRVVRRANPDGVLRWYPGSPKLVRALLRPGDRLVACELHPDDARLLKRAFAGDRAVEVRHEDGWQALKALLPPPERRGIVAIDPSFERRDDLERMVRALKDAHRRWATGTYVLWYPVKDAAEVTAFHDGLVASRIRRILIAELMLRPAVAEGALAGCGLAIVNPPWQLDAALERLLPALARVLGAGARTRLETLVPE